MRETALRSDNPLYRADLFFLDARDEIRNTLEFAPSPATAMDTELGSDDLVLTIKVLAEALYDGYNHHIQIGNAHNRGDSTVDLFDMMQAELHRRLRNDSSIYAKCHEKYKQQLKGPVITF